VIVSLPSPEKSTYAFTLPTATNKVRWPTMPVGRKAASFSRSTITWNCRPRLRNGRGRERTGGRRATAVDRIAADRLIDALLGDEPPWVINVDVQAPVFSAQGRFSASRRAMRS